MKILVVVCLENGDVLESDLTDCSKEEYNQILEVVKELKNLVYFTMPIDGDTVYINPKKIMWIKPRIYE